MTTLHSAAARRELRCCSMQSTRLSVMMAKHMSSNRDHNTSRQAKRSQSQAVELALIFLLLANENRLLILHGLLTAGELSVGALAKIVKLSQSALSQQLAKLRAQNIVATRRDGQTVFYRIARNPRAQYTASLIDHGFTKR